MVGLGWIARYFVDLFVENTTLYIDKHGAPPKDTPIACTLDLLKPLGDFTWLLPGQWDRVVSQMNLPLESLGFEEHPVGSDPEEPEDEDPDELMPDALEPTVRRLEMLHLLLISQVTNTLALAIQSSLVSPGHARVNEIY